jgi:hypothetical protein
MLRELVAELEATRQRRIAGVTIADLLPTLGALARPAAAVPVAAEAAPSGVVQNLE